MINEVRNAVLAFLNKNNYGYISPQDFNLYAKQAQLDLFEDLFFQYNYQINKENARQSGTGYADIKKGIEEDIDIFSQDVVLLHTAGGLYGTTNSSNQFALPNDYYFINKVYFRPFVQVYAGLWTAPQDYRLITTTVGLDFNAVQQGDFVLNTSPNANAPTTAFVVGQEAAQTLVLSENIIPAAGPVSGGFSIFSNKYITDIERVSQSKVNKLLSSTLTAPSYDFPVYTVNGNNINIYPMDIGTRRYYGAPTNNYNYVFCQYIRYPRDPKWTFVNITNGEPVFDQSQPDYQNFELPEDMYSDLVLKILQYSGVSIREIDVTNFASTEETKNNQTEA